MSLVVGNVAWPPAYDGGPSVAPAQPSGGSGYPPTHWPSAQQLDYTQKAITVLLLALALPWLSWKLLTNPGYVLAGAGRHHIKPTA